MAGALSWDQAIQDIPDSGLTRERLASPDELASVAGALELLACRKLAAAYTISPTGAGHYRLQGRVEAALEQTCVITLEPVAAEVAETFDIAFWPESDIPAPASGELDLEDEDEPEPIVDGQIEVGRIVFEALAGAVDPFPRKPDAALDRVTASPAGAADGKPESPFAVLARIKEKG
jgi:uncharacterized metal-binding protein YceD (DUF177 family)